MRLPSDENEQPGLQCVRASYPAWCAVPGRNFTSLGRCWELRQSPEPAQADVFLPLPGVPRASGQQLCPGTRLFPVPKGVRVGGSPAAFLG